MPTMKWLGEKVLPAVKEQVARINHTHNRYLFAKKFPQAACF